jgi:ferric iron reductase protein FhuF
VAAIEISEALARAGQVGPYFALDHDRGEDWLPFSALLDDPAVPAERVGWVRTTLASRSGLSLADVEERACASVHFLGLASRVLAPALGSAALGSVVPDVDPVDVWWRPVAGGPIPMWWTRVRGTAASTAEQAGALIDSGVLSRVVAPLAERFATTFQVSGQVLSGNSASALAGAAAMLTRSGRNLVLDPVEIVRATIRTSALAGSGAYRPATGSESAFVRNNCCLFYRIPGAGLCGDCVLASPPGAAPD